MEIQEQQFVRELAESRMQIELLRNRVLLRYYAQLLELDIMEQTQEVKALMSSINTLERYARKYEPKEPTVEPVPVENGGSGPFRRTDHRTPARAGSGQGGWCWRPFQGSAPCPPPSSLW